MSHWHDSIFYTFHSLDVYLNPSVLEAINLLCSLEHLNGLSRWCFHIIIIIGIFTNHNSGTLTLLT